jgi:hypothetical protein
MLFIILIIYFIARKLVPRAGTILIIGLITALLKLFYAGGNKIAPAVAIFLEALIIEIILDCLPLNRISAILTGAFVQPFTLFYPFLSYIFIGGSAGMLEKLLDDRGGFLKGLDPHQIILSLILIYIVAGAIEGMVAWSIASNSVNYYELHIKKNRTMEVL